MNNIEKKDYYNILYSFYSSLLTDKQKEVFEEYYYNDYSLSEIAEDSSVSRSAIYDTLTKVEKLLDSYEDKLHLKEKNDTLIKKLEELKSHTDNNGKNIINEILDME